MIDYSHRDARRWRPHWSQVVHLDLPRSAIDPATTAVEHAALEHKLLEARAHLAELRPTHQAERGRLARLLRRWGSRRKLSALLRPQAE